MNWFTDIGSRNALNPLFPFCLKYNTVLQKYNLISLTCTKFRLLYCQDAGRLRCWAKMNWLDVQIVSFVSVRIFNVLMCHCCFAGIFFKIDTSISIVMRSVSIYHPFDIVLIVSTYLFQFINKMLDHFRLSWNLSQAGKKLHEILIKSTESWCKMDCYAHAAFKVYELGVRNRAASSRKPCASGGTWINWNVL